MQIQTRRSRAETLAVNQYQRQQQMRRVIHRNQEFSTRRRNEEIRRNWERKCHYKKRQRKQPGILTAEEIMIYAEILRSMKKVFQSKMRKASRFQATKIQSRRNSPNEGQVTGSRQG